jgi:phosphoenolpyruvate---glycerone phosphotransferase subunit DhaL
MLNTSDFVSILKETAVDFASHAEELRELDSVIGDGDLGVTIELGSRALTEYLSRPDANNISQLLLKCGLQFNKASPSTFGTLLASAFMGAGKAAAGKESIDFNELGLLADGAVEGIKSRGKAELGDKTMLDCIVPAVKTFKKKLAEGMAPKDILREVTQAAEAGMKATIPMMSKHGRAAWHREKTIGLQDAGATAMYYLIESLARHLASRIS